MSFQVRAFFSVYPEVAFAIARSVATARSTASPRPGRQRLRNHWLEQVRL